MAHWRERFKETDKHLGAVDLWVDESKTYRQIEVTIERFVEDKLVGSMGEEKKTFVKFKEFPKMMVVNKTNFRRLSKLFNSVDDNDYIGKKVVLGVESVRDPQGGGNTDALRFSTRAAKQAVVSQKKELSEENLVKAIGLVSKGSKTVEWVCETYEVSADQLKRLKDAVPVKG